MEGNYRGVGSETASFRNQLKADTESGEEMTLKPPLCGGHHKHVGVKSLVGLVLTRCPRCRMKWARILSGFLEEEGLKRPLMEVCVPELYLGYSVPL